MGSVYQSGFIYSIDDTTPTAGSIGGKVLALTDQAAHYPSGIVWSFGSPPHAIYGISEISTSSSPNPSTGPIAGQSACNGASDGSCDTINIVTYYNGTSLTQYASGLCKASIGGYTDWYLPAICEMGPNGCSGIPNIVNNLSSLISPSCMMGTSCLAGSYWSSTEQAANSQPYAWSENFASGSGSQFAGAKSDARGVRCSRALTP
jgi:hypothetical protein